MKYAVLVLAFLGFTFAQQVGSLAPDFVLRDADNQVIRITDFRGQGLLLNFWASWCIPCQEELPLFQELSEEAENLNVLLINNNETLEQAMSYLEANAISLRSAVDSKLPSEVAMDKTLDVLKRYRVRGMPTSFFINEEGIIESLFVGQITPGVLAERLAEIGVIWQP